MTRNVADADAWFPYDRCVRHDRKKRVIAAIAAKKAVKPGVNSNRLLYIAGHIMPKRFISHRHKLYQFEAGSFEEACFQIF